MGKKKVYLLKVRLNFSEIAFGIEEEKRIGDFEVSRLSQWMMEAE